jgi:hypothetical protein
MDTWIDLFATSLASAAVPDVDVTAVFRGADGASCTIVASGGSARVEPHEARSTGTDIVVRSTRATLRELLATGHADWRHHDREVLCGDLWRPALPGLGGPARAFESIPRATMTVFAEVHDTLAGVVGLTERWEDGVLIALTVSDATQPVTVRSDIAIVCRLEHLAAIRLGAATPLDVLAGGVGIVGEWPVLMCYAELARHQQLLDAWSARGNVAAEVALGRLLAAPGFADAARTVRVGSAEHSAVSA